MTSFRQRIRTAILDQNLQQALDANAERRVKGRMAAFASLPDWRERRQKAHAIRAEVIEHLPNYLDEFARNVQSNGIIVHRAKDADEAVKIILEIAESNGSSRWGGQGPEGGRPRNPKLFA